METTRLSTKGQIVLPKSVRTAHAWRPGTELIVEDTGDGVLLRRASRIAKTSLDEVVGCLQFKGKPKTLAQMKGAIGREMISRHNRGRY
jgi:AbrB family looped-hinge helix DNA binding protein